MSPFQLLTKKVKIKRSVQLRGGNTRNILVTVSHWNCDTHILTVGLIDLQTSSVIISCCECMDKIPYSTNRSVSILDFLTQTVSVVMIFQVRYQSLKMILLSQMANERQYSVLEGFEDNCQNQRLETCRYRDPCFYPTQFSVFVKCRRQLYVAVCCGLQHICTGSDSNSLEPPKNH